METSRHRSAEVVIVGAGLAGAATAFFLAQRGVRDVLILEQESMPGVHASGRNAAMVRQVVPDPDVAALARAGADFIRSADHAPHRSVCYEQNGSLLLGVGPDWEGLRRDARRAREAGATVECLSPTEAMHRVPVLRDVELDGAVWCASDGVVDVAALLDRFLEGAREAGVRLHTDCRVTGFEVRSGHIAGVLTQDGPIYTNIVVNAAGAWAGEFGRLAGAAPIPLTPYRRHLFATGPLDWVVRRWPFVWDVSHDLYFRPESGGLLLSPCDDKAWSPEIPPVDPAIAELLAQRVTHYYPALATIPIKRAWAGLRTFAADRRPVIGWDPRLKGFFWVAGLGGHGVTVSGSVGLRAAELVHAGPRLSGGAFDPGRFA